MPHNFSTGEKPIADTRIGLGQQIRSFLKGGISQIEKQQLEAGIGKQAGLPRMRTGSRRQFSKGFRLL